MTTRASPDLATSKPSPLPGPPEASFTSSARSLASLALSVPRWYSVAGKRRVGMGGGEEGMGDGGRKSRAFSGLCSQVAMECEPLKLLRNNLLRWTSIIDR